MLVLHPKKMLSLRPIITGKANGKIQGRIRSCTSGGELLDAKKHCAFFVSMSSSDKLEKRSRYSRVIHLEAGLLQNVHQALLRGLIPPSKRRDKLRVVGWILVHENFVELVEFLPCLILHMATAATEVVLQPVWPVRLVPLMVAMDKAASSTQNQVLVLAVRCKV